jgi:hypothetical protein
MSENLDIAVTICFLLAGLSLIVSTTTEVVSNLVKLRGLMLAGAIEQLLGKSGPISFAEFKAHPLYQAQCPAPPRVWFLTTPLRWLFALWSLLFRTADARRLGWPRVPAYLPAETFATVSVDLMMARAPNAGLGRIADLRTWLATQTPDGFVLIVRSLTHDTGVTLDQLHAKLGAVFDRAMGRVSGWYRRRIWMLNASAGLMLAFALNADLWSIHAILRRQKAATEHTADAIRHYVSANPSPKTGATAPTRPPANELKSEVPKDAAGNIVAPGADILNSIAKEGSAQAPATPTPSSASAAKPSPNSGSDTGSGQPGKANIDTALLAQTSVAWLAIWSDNLLPLGWADESSPAELRLKEALALHDCRWWFRKFGRLIVTMLLLGLGAPFWFDLLARFVAVRGSEPPKAAKT